MIITYQGKYLTKDIISKCFKEQTHNKVDKVSTGNGFTTSFLELKPTNEFQSNIIIVPNREVLISKREKYIKDTSPTKTRIAFIYGDENKDRISFRDFDVLMFVVDSFVDRIEYLYAHKNLIDKILIDEMHSMLIQSEFRKKLKEFNTKVDEYFYDKSIVSVTATPMLYQHIDIELKTDINSFKDINVTTNEEKCFNRVKENILQGKKTIIATHNAHLISKLKNKKGVLKANFKVGKSLFQNLVERCKIEQDAESNITIISSTGFEGFDVENGVNDIFIFEDRSQDYSTFYFQNVLQIIGRSRNGVGKIEYCRNTHSKGRKIFDVASMEKTIKSKRISFEKLLTDKNYYYIPKFYETVFDFEHKGIIKGLELDTLKYNLYTEKANADNEGLSIYVSYALKRGYKLKFLDEGIKRLGKKKGESEKVKFKNIKENLDFIKNRGIYKDVKINQNKIESLSDSFKELRKYLRRRHYENLLYIDDFKNFNIDEYFFKVCTKREYESYKILLSGFNDDIKENRIQQLTKQLTKNYKVRKSIEYSKNHNKAYKQEVTDFESNIENVLVNLILVFAQKKVSIAKNIRMWRDYNVLTKTSLKTIEDIASLFDLSIYEYDIKSCNARIIYAYCGLELPNNFYGKGKKNKKKINILLNQLSKDYAVKNKLNVTDRKKRLKRDLIKYNFNPKVADFLIKTFWDKPTDALFNWCAYYEERIIRNLQKELISRFEDSEFSFIRRHDSVILIKETNKEIDHSLIESTLRFFSYLRQKGWFIDVENVKGIKTQITVEVTKEKKEVINVTYLLSNGYKLHTPVVNANRFIDFICISNEEVNSLSFNSKNLTYYSKKEVDIF